MVIKSTCRSYLFYQLLPVEAQVREFRWRPQLIVVEEIGKNEEDKYQRGDKNCLRNRFDILKYASFSFFLSFPIIEIIIRNSTAMNLRNRTLKTLDSSYPRRLDWHILSIMPGLM
jgi:hypothetical protein